MSAPTIRSDYDQLKSVAQTFSQQAETLNGMTNNVRSCMDTLQGGDWIGQGAQAFFKEMNDSILPTLKRLNNAMSESSRITGQISQIMKQAEDSASKVFVIRL
jgi:WXG100 family type VII secretion target